MATKLLVIGGTSGIGKEVAYIAPYVIRGINAEPVFVQAVGEEECDVTDPEKLDQVVRKFCPTHVVYSAGINHLEWIENSTPQDFAKVLAVNLIGFQTLLTSMLSNGIRNASIVAVSSDAATRPMRTSLMYCSSKAALSMSVKCAARELASKGYRINSVSPGKVADTEMTRYVDSVVPGLRGWTEEYAWQREIDSSPLGRYLTTNEVAWAVLDVLFGPDALTGSDIVINGGR